MAGPSSTLHRFYRGTTFQAIILGLVSFTQPGLWDALNSLGAGGQASPYIVNAANAITFAIMVIFCPVAAVFGNKYSLRWLVTFGTLGFVPYFAALYCNTVYGTEWFLLFGAVTCGFSAAALWTGEGAVAVGYPEDKRRGMCVAIWLALNKVGRVIACSIQLGLNTHGDQQGSVGPSTYLVLMGLSCAGLPLSLLLAPPNKLIRRDGTKPAPRNANLTFAQGFRDLWRALRTRHIYLLVPIFITAQFGSTYNGNYLAAYFTVRARTLAGLVAVLGGIVTNFMVGVVLDSARLRRSLRARCAWVGIAVVFVAAWIYQFVVQAELQRSPAVFDWSTPGFANAVLPYIIYRLGFEAVSPWMYWMLGTHNEPLATVAYAAGILRSGESLGATVSYGVGASKAATLMDNLILAAVVWFVAVPTTVYCVWTVKDGNETLQREQSPDTDEGVFWTNNQDSTKNSGVAVKDTRPVEP